MAVLGIDTSNYTTSVALYSPEDNALISKRQLLYVAKGERGLRQSEALFQHTKNLPHVMHSAFNDSNQSVTAVGVSEKPRDTEDSYMPCFLAGVSAATTASCAVNCKLHKFSHQRGHIAAAVYSANSMHLFKDEFLAFHVSGGTTELLHIAPHDDLIIRCELSAATLDLNAGQIIDRVGVLLGLDFPCGPQLEKLANEGSVPKKYKPVLKNGNCCLSGVENLCADMYKRGISKNDIARFCIDAVSKTIREMSEFALSKHGNLPIVYAGGVMSNSIIKSELENNFNCVFSKPEFSCDNAAGIAILTAIKEGYIKL